MALISLSVGNHPLPFIGATATPVGTQSWFTAVNVDVYAVSPNGLGYGKNAGGSNQQFAAFTQFVPATGGLYTTYILVVKQAFSVDSALFGIPVSAGSGGTKVFPPLVGPAGETTTEFVEQYFFDQASTPSVSFSQGAGTLEFSYDGGLTWSSMPASLVANNGFNLRVQHPDNAAFTATLTLTYA